MNDQPDLPPDYFPAWWEFCQRPENDGQPAHNTAGDAGGWTAWGITYAEYKAEAIRFGCQPDLPSFLHLTQANAQPFGKALYWDEILADHMPVGAGVIWCDFAFTSGGGTRTLQKMLGVSSDGIVGVKTLAALQVAWEADANGLLTEMTTARIAYYESLGEPKFLNGWTRRAKDCLTVALGLLESVS